TENAQEPQRRFSRKSTPRQTQIDQERSIRTSQYRPI
ncbi:MAG: hypothetical protein, partial [Olavius algarvensis Gamma 1 endosymbiont]